MVLIRLTPGGGVLLWKFGVSLLVEDTHSPGTHRRRSWGSVISSFSRDCRGVDPGF